MRDSLRISETTNQSLIKISEWLVKYGHAGHAESILTFRLVGIEKNANAKCKTVVKSFNSFCNRDQWPVHNVVSVELSFL